MTIAVDFDGTCVKHKYPLGGEDVDGALRMILSIVLNIKTLLYHFKSPFMRMQKTWRKKNCR